MRPPKTACCLLALVALLAGPVTADAVDGASERPEVVRGRAWALYDVSSVRGERYCLPYANNGYSLEVRESDAVSRRVLVRSSTADLDCRAAFPPAPGSIPPDAVPYLESVGERAELAERCRALTSGCRTQVEAVRRIICWVSSAIDYRDGPDVPVDPRDVLRQGSANCVGAAELAVALLREAGIPARGVRGFLVPAETGTAAPAGGMKREQSLGEEGLHRWIEVYYPGAGWVFSDPFRSVDYVGPRYLVFDVEQPPGGGGPARFGRARPELRSSASTFIQRLDAGGILLAVDRLPGPGARSGLTVRRNGPLQYAPALVGVVGGRGTGDPDEARLRPLRGTADDTVRVTGVRRGLFSFTGLATGTYRLDFYREGTYIGSGRATVHYPPRHRGVRRIEIAAP